MNAQKPSISPPLWRSEAPLAVGCVLTLITMLLVPHWFIEPAANPVRSVFMFSLIFASILWSAFAVVRHADCLAILLGEPLGTIILTISVIGIEVTMISMVMLTGEPDPTLGRDTMFSVLMLVLNGMVGITLLVGGLHHREPMFNLRGASAYMSVIIPLAMLGLILPRYTKSTSDASASPLLATFLVVTCICLYGVFLGVQTMRHRSFFTQPSNQDSDASHLHDPIPSMRTVPFHALLLLATMIPIVLLAKKLAILMEVGIDQMNAPPQLAGLAVAILVLTPEGVSALRAAQSNQLQRGVNICLGSALATIGLTIPAVLLIGSLAGMRVQLGLDQLDELLLMLTLLVSVVTFSSGRTNILQGVVHIVLFLAWLVLIFD
jgi:Ca2+:H+ antiporter